MSDQDDPLAFRLITDAAREDLKAEADLRKKAQELINKHEAERQNELRQQFEAGWRARGGQEAAQLEAKAVFHETMGQYDFARHCRTLAYATRQLEPPAAQPATLPAEEGKP